MSFMNVLCLVWVGSTPARLSATLLLKSRARRLLRPTNAADGNPRVKSHMLGLVGYGSHRRSESWMVAMRARKLQNSQDEFGTKSSKAKDLDKGLHEHYAVRHRDTDKVSRTFNPKRRNMVHAIIPIGYNSLGACELRHLLAKAT